jgi:hypothetical protein
LEVAAPLLALISLQACSEKHKALDEGCAKIGWIEHGVTSLKKLSRALSDRKGIDVISCCSAFVLLMDLATTTMSWASLPGSGGKMIIDVPTEDKTLQHLFTVDLRSAMGPTFTLPFDRSWTHDIRSLEKFYEEARLVVEKSWRTKSYIPEKWYEGDKRDAVFEEQTPTT